MNAHILDSMHELHSRVNDGTVDRAMDLFRHPYAHAGRRGISTRPGGARPALAGQT